MTSVITKLFASLLLTSVFLGACSDRFQKGSYQYLIPFLNSDGSYTWREVELTTLDSPTKLSGSTASIYYKPTEPSTQKWGAVVQPKLTRSGDVWIPQDAASAVALSAYASLEAIRKWEAKIHPAAEKVYPRKVILEVAAKDKGQEVTDNAFYIPGWDVVLVVPYTGDAVPIAVNRGIMAHEHFHVQFHHQILSPSSEPFSHLREEDLSTSQKNNLKENSRLLRSWNEGLADFYAYSFTSQARFMDVSKLAQPEMMLLRALDFPFQSLDRNFMVEKDRISVDEKTHTCTSGSPYCLGTQVGRLLYQMSEGNPSKAHNLLRLMYKNFPRWQTNVKQKLLSSTMQTNEFLEWTFANEKGLLDQSQIDLLKKVGVQP